jgi:hypothetical protein
VLRAVIGLPLCVAGGRMRLNVGVSRGAATVVSRQAIAAALAREDLAGGERLVAFSLASFAGRDGRAWPGAPAAAARAGLSRSRYLHDRAGLGAGAG